MIRSLTQILAFSLIGTMATAEGIIVKANYLAQERSWCPAGTAALIEVLMDGPDVFTRLLTEADEQATVHVRRGGDRFRIKTKIAGDCATSGSCPREAPKTVKKIGRFQADFEVCQSLPDVTAKGDWTVSEGSQIIHSGTIEPSDRFEWRGLKAPFLQAIDQERSDLLIDGLGHLSVLTRPGDFELILGNPERSK